MSRSLVLAALCLRLVSAENMAYVSLSLEQAGAQPFPSAADSYCKGISGNENRMMTSYSQFSWQNEGGTVSRHNKCLTCDYNISNSCDWQETGPQPHVIYTGANDQHDFETTALSFQVSTSAYFTLKQSCMPTIPPPDFACDFYFGELSIPFRILIAEKSTLCCMISFNETINDTLMCEQGEWSPARQEDFGALAAQGPAIDLCFRYDVSQCERFRNLLDLSANSSVCGDGGTCLPTSGDSTQYKCDCPNPFQRRDQDWGGELTDYKSTCVGPLPLLSAGLSTYASEQPELGFLLLLMLSHSPLLNGDLLVLKLPSTFVEPSVDLDFLFVIDLDILYAGERVGSWNGISGGSAVTFNLTEGGDLVIRVLYGGPDVLTVPLTLNLGVLLPLPLFMNYSTGQSTPALAGASELEVFATTQLSVMRPMVDAEGKAVHWMVGGSGREPVLSSVSRSDLDETWAQLLRDLWVPSLLRAVVSSNATQVGVPTLLSFRLALPPVLLRKVAGLHAEVMAAGDGAGGPVIRVKIDWPVSLAKYCSGQVVKQLDGTDLEQSSLFPLSASDEVGAVEEGRAATEVLFRLANFSDWSPNTAWASNRLLFRVALPKGSRYSAAKKLDAGSINVFWHPEDQERTSSNSSAGMRRPILLGREVGTWKRAREGGGELFPLFVEGAGCNEVGVVSGNAVVNGCDSEGEEGGEVGVVVIDGGDTEVGDEGEGGGGGVIVTPVVDIILAPNGTNQTTTFVFDLPFNPNATALATRLVTGGRSCVGASAPQCEWLDEVTQTWSKSGCVTSRTPNASNSIRCVCSHLTVFAAVVRARLDPVAFCAMNELDIVFASVYVFLAAIFLYQAAMLTRGLLQGFYSGGGSSFKKQGLCHCLTRRGKLLYLQLLSLFGACVFRFLFLLLKPILSPATRVMFALLPSSIELSLFCFLALSWLQAKNFKYSSSVKLQRSSSARHGLGRQLQGCISGSSAYVRLSCLIAFTCSTVTLALVATVSAIPQGEHAAFLAAAQAGSYAWAGMSAASCLIVLICGYLLVKEIKTVTKLARQNKDASTRTGRIELQSRLLRTTLCLSFCLVMHAFLWVAAVSEGTLKSAQAGLAVDGCYYFLDVGSMVMIMYLFRAGFSEEVKSLSERHQLKARQVERTRAREQNRRNKKQLQRQNTRQHMTHGVELEEAGTQLDDSDASNFLSSTTGITMFTGLPQSNSLSSTMIDTLKTGNTSVNVKGSETFPDEASKEGI